MIAKTLGILLATVLTLGCAGSAPPPAAGEYVGAIPDLRGRRVMLFPTQIGSGVPGDASPEIAFALRAKGTQVDWVAPEELEALLARSPSVDSRVRGLAVGVFLNAEVERIGDPLFGQLLRLGTLANSDFALIPVTVRPGAEGVDGVSVVEIVATILNVRTGGVIWFGVVAGRPGSVSDFATVASAAEALAETLLWYVR